jgi:hypothetical protein
MAEDCTKLSQLGRRGFRAQQISRPLGIEPRAIRAITGCYADILGSNRTFFGQLAGHYALYCGRSTAHGIRDILGGFRGLRSHGFDRVDNLGGFGRNVWDFWN